MFINYPTISLFVLIMSFMAFGLNAKESKPEPTAKMELVKVASLNTIDSNKEFQRNVQLVQQQRALAAELLSKMDTIQDEEEHNKLQTELDGLQQKLNENNELMFKTYGFSLNRNYVLTVEKSHIHMWVTEEESKKISAANKKAKK
jgi:flagellar biosynthesis component FlhA